MNSSAYLPYSPISSGNHLIFSKGSLIKKRAKRHIEKKSSERYAPVLKIIYTDKLQRRKKHIKEVTSITLYAVIGEKMQFSIPVTILPPSNPLAGSRFRHARKRETIIKYNVCVLSVHPMTKNGKQEIILKNGPAAHRTISFAYEHPAISATIFAPKSPSVILFIFTPIILAAKRCPHSCTNAANRGIKRRCVDFVIQNKIKNIGREGDIFIFISIFLSPFNNFLCKYQLMLYNMSCLSRQTPC